MQIARRFLSTDSGNVAMMFAIAIIPVLGFISLAVDYSRASALRDRMQSAADSAALAGASMPGSTSIEDLESKVTDILRTTTTDKDLRGMILDVDADALTVTVRSSGYIASTFASVLGVSKLDISSYSKAQRPRTAKADIALVLDNTGSMNSDGKLDALKKAVSAPVTGLTAKLRNAFSARPNDVRISLIPFSVGVRLSTVDSQLAGRITPLVNLGWSGCVSDRPGNHDIKNKKPDNADASSFLPRQHGNRAAVVCPGTSVKALTSNLNDVDAQINAMQAAGNTNATVGLLWGRQSLQENGLLEGGLPRSQTDLTRYLILLTDGDNTQSYQFSQSGATARSTPIDDKMIAMCENIRTNDGVIIYTIGFGSGISNAAKSKLAQCAGHADRAKLANNSADLNEVFAAIASDVQRTRLLR